jgi:hypothetical protein
MRRAEYASGIATPLMLRCEPKASLEARNGAPTGILRGPLRGHLRMRPEEDEG